MRLHLKIVQIINVPDELRGIGNCAFEGCEKLQLFDLPKELTSISGHAFEGIPPVKKMSNVTCKPYKKSLYKHKTKKIKKGYIIFHIKI